MPETGRLAADAASRFVADVFARLGLPADDARRIADAMVEADLTGADAHGLFRLEQYVQALEAGRINARPDMQVHVTGAATALIDGDNGMGHLAALQAVEIACGLARSAGVGWVGVRRSNHAGAGGVYAAMPPKQGMVGLYTAVAGVNQMAPSGGALPLLGSNPLAIAVPRGDRGPLMVDVAMSQVSLGAVKARSAAGHDLPEGWMVHRRTGETLRDPRRTSDGLLVPMGGHKGLGLSFMLGLLAGPMLGASFGRELGDFAKGGGLGVGAGQLLVAVDVERFVPRESFELAIEHHIADFLGSPRMAAAKEVRLPGTERERRRAERLRNGVPAGPELMAALRRVGERVGSAPPGPVG